MRFKLWLENDGNRYFDSSAIQNAANQSSKSREKLIAMSPDDFLAMAEELEGPDASIGRGNIDKMKRIEDLVSRNKPFDSIPFLGFEHDGKGNAVVVSHEGRHRAIILKSLGITTMPVLFISQGRGAIRWGEQDNPNSIDRIKGIWPQTLKGESGGRIKFPVRDPLATS